MYTYQRRSQGGQWGRHPPPLNDYGGGVLSPPPQDLEEKIKRGWLKSEEG